MTQAGPWTDEEVAMLIRMLDAGHFLPEIAKALGRTPSGTRCKANKLGRRISKGPHPGHVWVGEALDEIKRRWKAGQSAATIAAALGVTRNAVIGALTRHGLARSDQAGRASASLSFRAANRQPRPPKLAKTDGTAMRSNVVALRPVSLLCEPKPLLELQSGDCRWPVNDGDDPKHGFLFCAAPKACEGPYCLDHRAVAFISHKTSPKEFARGLRRYA